MVNVFGTTTNDNTAVVNQLHPVDKKSDIGAAHGTWSIYQPRGYIVKNIAATKLNEPGRSTKPTTPLLAGEGATADRVSTRFGFTFHENRARY